MSDSTNEVQPAKRPYTRRKSYSSYGSGKPYHAFSVLFYDPKELELVKKESAESLDAEEYELTQELSEVTEENSSTENVDTTVEESSSKATKTQDTDFKKLKDIFDNSPLKKTIKDLGVLNSGIPNSKIRFFKDSITSKYEVLMFKDDKPQSDITKDWDYMLFKIFDSFFLVTKLALNQSDPNLKVGNGEVRFYGCTSKECSLPKNSGLRISEDNVYEDFSHRIVLGNRSVLVGGKGCSKVLTRVLILYLLAQAYIKQMEKYADEIALGSDNAKSTYRQMLKFNINYFYKVPFKASRIQQTGDYWKTIYNFFAVDTVKDEMVNKVQSYAMEANSKNRFFWSTLLSVAAVLVSILAFIYSIIMAS